MIHMFGRCMCWQDPSGAGLSGSTEVLAGADGAAEGRARVRLGPPDGGGDSRLQHRRRGASCGRRPADGRAGGHTRVARLPQQHPGR